MDGDCSDDCEGTMTGNIEDVNDCDNVNCSGDVITQEETDSEDVSGPDACNSGDGNDSGD
jgi:hypothetical protein